jgi:hypothetical protein
MSNFDEKLREKYFKPSIEVLPWKFDETMGGVLWSLIRVWMKLSGEC